jgi:hypothetical protein
MDALEDGVLDGNAIGGMLIEVFGAETTTAVGTCGSFGTRGRWPRWRYTSRSWARWSAVAYATTCS